MSNRLNSLRNEFGCAYLVVITIFLWVIIMKEGEGAINLTLGMGMAAVVIFYSHKLKKKGVAKKFDFLATESEFTNSLIQLITAVIKEDKKESSSEIHFLENALLKYYSTDRVKTLLTQINKHATKTEFPIEQICRLIKTNFDTATKVQLMHLLVGIAAADGLLTKKEEQLLKSIAVEIRIPFVTYKQILSMFRFRYEGQQQKKKKKTYTSLHRLKNAYSVLGLTTDATEKEIKKAYRKLAVIHHPDKVAHLGPEIQVAANDKFLVISEAYELIKKKKGFA